MISRRSETNNAPSAPLSLRRRLEHSLGSYGFTGTLRDRERNIKIEKGTLSLDSSRLLSL